ncbi:MAG TPA: hypothetical protein VMU66_01670, partial [Gaiellales bacterium]|nr:hypothetical protein [Gaiellales bacterium]
MPPSRVVHPSHLLLPPPRRRRTLRLIAGGAALVYWMPAPLAVLPPLPDALGVHRRLRSRPGVMLTFDDGPHPE